MTKKAVRDGQLGKGQRGQAAPLKVGAGQQGATGSGNSTPPKGGSSMKPDKSK